MPALTFAAIQSLFKYQSGRVIALGRVMLAALFLLALIVDPSQPAEAAAQTYGFLALYLIAAVALAAVTWRNWWLDARLATGAHIADMAVFTVIVFSTNGYTSPFFLFFVLPLLSSAIRWSWRETGLTAVALVALYLTASVVASGTEPFESQRFIIRSGHLMILSTLLIWFGIHQRVTRLFFRLDELERSGIEDPLRSALHFAMNASGARSGFVVMRVAPGQPYRGIRLAADGASSVELAEPLLATPGFGSSILFDTRIGGALTRTPEGRTRFTRTARLFAPGEAERLALGEGLVAQVSSSTGEGWLVLGDMPDLSTDYVELGDELARAVRTITDRAALVGAIEQGAAARTRLTLARDVHDGMIQFLAGATFRIEAIARAARGGADVDRELRDLKGLLVEEQRDIRGFVNALRRDRELALGDAVDELRTLATRLSQHWAVKCKVRLNGEEAPIPIRLQLDLQQLLREGVANAVRHGGASKVDVSLRVDGDLLLFNIRDNGCGFAPANGNAPVEPWSLKERVERANGSLLLVSERGRTDVAISLPIAGAAA